MQENENKVVVIAGLSDASVAVIDLTREVCFLRLPLLSLQLACLLACLFAQPLLALPFFPWCPSFLRARCVSCLRAQRVCLWPWQRQTVNKGRQQRAVWREEAALAVSREKAVVSRLMCEHVVACGMWHVACGACGNERRSFCTCTKVTRILYEEGSACTKRGSSSQVPCFLPSCIAQLYCAPSRSQGAPCRLP